MRNPALEPLLILQDRDLRRAGLEAQLKSIPGEVALVERKIASEKAAIEAAKAEIKELEVRKKDVETEIGTAEQRLGKYRTQQLAVKKNDEYQALGHEIETMQGQIGTLEGKELEIMYGIDEAKKRFAAAEAGFREIIGTLEGRIKILREREANVNAELGEARSAVAAARPPVPADVLAAFDRVAPRYMHAVVASKGD